MGQRQPRVTADEIIRVFQVQDMPAGKVTRSPLPTSTGSPLSGVTATSPSRK